MTDRAQTISFRRRNLPHWLVADRPYFVTFRLKGTLPPSVVREYELAVDALRARGAPKIDVETAQRQHFARIDAILDRADAPLQLLTGPAVARLIMDGFEWLQEERGWHVYAAVVMPSHVHCCLLNTRGLSKELSSDIGALKKFTARRANDLLGRRGAFWQSENFDHWCRGTEKLAGTVQYIVRNPVKAGLVKSPEDWQWLRYDRDVLSA